MNGRTFPIEMKHAAAEANKLSVPALPFSRPLCTGGALLLDASQIALHKFHRLSVGRSTLVVLVDVPWTCTFFLECFLAIPEHALTAHTIKWQ